MEGGMTYLSVQQIYEACIDFFFFSFSSCNMNGSCVLEKFLSLSLIQIIWYSAEESFRI